MAAPRKWHGQVTLTDDTEAVVYTCPSSTKTVYVTKLTLTIKTHANTKVVQVKDTDDVVIAAHTDLTAAAGVPSTVTWDFGRGGVPLTVGLNLVAVAGSATGVAGVVYAEGYTI